MATTTGPINGSKLLIYTSTDDGVTYTPIASSTDNSLEISMDTREANTKASSGWREYLPSFKSWTMGGESLVALDDTNGFSEIFGLMDNQTVVKVKFGTGIVGDKYWEGDAVFTSLSLSAPQEDNTTFSYSLQGSSALTESTES